MYVCVQRGTFVRTCMYRGDIERILYISAIQEVRYARSVYVCLCAARDTQARVILATHSVQNAFYGEHILERTHSRENTF